MNALIMGLHEEKKDLEKAMRMLESLNRDHRISIAAAIDAYRREELLEESGRKEELVEV